jgi:hypothetical protein
VIGISVRLDIRALERSLNSMQRELIPKAASRAINRAIDSTATAAAREIAAATRLKVGEVRKRLKVRKASPSRLVAELQAFGYAPNLGQFRATQRRDGVAATAWEKRKTYKGAFILPTGKVVARTSAKRFPLKGLRGPSLTSNFKTQRVQAKMEAVARQVWRDRFDREMARLLRGAS